MTQAPSSLKTAVDGMTGEIRLRAHSHAGALAVLFALIDAYLLRILTRLADIIALWQTGQRPTPSNQATRAPINFAPDLVPTPRPTPHPVSASPRHNTGARHQTPLAASALELAPQPAIRPARHPAPRPTLSPPSRPKTPPHRLALRHQTAFPLDPRRITPLGHIALACPLCYVIEITFSPAPHASRPRSSQAPPICG